MRAWLIATSAVMAFHLVAALPALAEGGVAYEVTILGAPTDDIQDLLERSSRLLGARDQRPATPAALDRRIADDVARFRSVLNSEGYYGHEIMTRIEGRDPVDIAIAISPGPVYLFSGLEILYRDGDAGTAGLPSDEADLGLELGMAARAAPLDAAADRLIRRLRQSGYPAPSLASARWSVDHATTTLAGRFEIALGDAKRFGPLRFEGLDTVSEGYLRALIGWRAGPLYDVRHVERARQTLVDTGLFDVVVVEPDPDAEARGDVLPMVARVEEDERRSISAGLAFASDEGLSAEIGWRHRNLGGNGESLRLSALGSATRQEGRVTLARPNVYRKGQTIEAATRLANEDSDAFDELTAEQTLSLSWPVGENLRLSAGPTLAFSRVEEDRTANNFALLGVFAASTYDDTDDPLDPTRGTRLRLRVQPNASVLGSEVGFLSAEMTGSAYWAAIGEDRVVLAARGRIGAIFGAATEDIPASRRFYGGGGGSVRGYGFREVGPLKPNNDPLGGRSVVEGGLEARIRVFGDFGIVPFVDAGQVFDSSIPNAEGGILWAAGLGFRYYTPIGPVRLDVARPLNAREVDDDFQLYISIGQAF